MSTVVNTVVESQFDPHAYLSSVLALADFVEARMNEQDDALASPFDPETGKFTDPAYDALAAHLSAVDEVIGRVRDRAMVAKTRYALTEVSGLVYALRAHAVAYRSHPDYQAAEWAL